MFSMVELLSISMYENLCSASRVKKMNLEQLMNRVANLCFGPDLQYEFSMGLWENDCFHEYDF